MIKSILLGLIQAVSEFLPVSSSGHLRIAEHFLGLGMVNTLSFEIALHFGTLAATCLVFFKDIRQAVTGFFSGLKSPRVAVRENEGFRISVMIVIATFPVAIAGFFLKNYLASVPLSRVGFNIAMTGSILLMTRKYDKDVTNKRDILSTTLLCAFLIGAAQAIAIFPGISRSGITISTALFLGLNRDLSGKFSFLLSIPAILGAVILSMKDFASFNPTMAISGFLTAFIFGYISLRLLLKFLHGGKLFYFGFYCITMGFATFLYFSYGVR